MMTGSSRVSRSRLSARVNSRPLVSGSIQSTSSRSGSLLATSARPAARIGGFADFESGAAQAERDHFANRALILDDQNLFG